MSLMTTAHLLDRYGPLLTEPQLAEVLHMYWTSPSRLVTHILRSAEA